LLPIYQAASIQYGVPWEILAAINEVETNYGNDLALSTAGAEGWMQFMPETWRRYGVDANGAGYADPYNPVDAIFAAARYLDAAGASKNLPRAIYAYNHSAEYVESVLLRAKLIARYPKLVIATLTGLAEGSLPTPGATVVQGSNLAGLPSGLTGAANASATASAIQLQSLRFPSAAGSNPGDAPPPGAGASAPVRSVELRGKPHARVVAVQDGRIVALGHSRKLGRYIELRDIYGDLFIYSGLGSIAPRYRPASDSAGGRPLAGAKPAATPAPAAAASAGYQRPVTLHVRRPSGQAPAPTPGAAAKSPSQSLLETRRSISPATGKVRLYAHPDNPVARAAARRDHASPGTHSNGGWESLQKGSIVARGTVLGHLAGGEETGSAYLRFAIRPIGDRGSVDPSAIIASWTQLNAALHPAGSRREAGLLGATADDALLMSKGQLQRAVLFDPSVKMPACVREEVSKGDVDKRALGVLAFLSRSGLRPTVSALTCADGTRNGRRTRFASVEISAVNDIPVAGHQGAGTITDTTIRALLALPHGFAPQRILSLMKYPGATDTVASAHDWNGLRLDFAPEQAQSVAAPPAQAARASRNARAPIVTRGELNPTQWNQLIERIAELPTSGVSREPSSASIPDHPGPAGEEALRQLLARGSRGAGMVPAP
jgi:hypothetical protein